jgi:GNAT superfamily N-acetyltransferase
MIEFRLSPPIPTKKTDALFTQIIHMLDGRELGRAMWAATGDGAVQILELWVDPSCRRAGIGRRLFRAMVENAREFHKLRDEKLRRLWIGVGHKSHIVGRSFLTSEGFHLITSTGGLLMDQDLLIYVKSLD